MTDLKLAWWLVRGQASRAWLLVFCVAIGVAAKVSVGSFMGQVDRALSLEARTLLAADLEIEALKPLSAEKTGQLRAEAGPAARLQQRAFFLSVLASEEPSSRARSRLCQVSAVEAGYPFYGTLEVELADGKTIVRDASLLDGSEPLAFVQPELLSQWNVSLGSSLRVGRLKFRIAGVVLQEPGLGGGAFSLGPRVLIGYRHLAATGLAGFGSRIQYGTLVALPEQEDGRRLSARLGALWKLGTFATPSQSPQPPSDSMRLRSARDAEQTLKRYFDRLGDFLNLTALMALLLGGIGVSSVVRLFVRGQIPSIGILRTLGASGPRITRIYLCQAVGLGLAGSLLGAALGTGAQNFLSGMLGDFFPVGLRGALDWDACLRGVGMGLLFSAVFSILPVLEIRMAAPAQLFRDEPGIRPPRRDFWIVAILASLLFIALGALEARSLPRGAGLVGAMLLGAAWISVVAGMILPRLARLRLGSPALRQGLSNLARPGLKPTAAVIALGCAALQMGVVVLYQHSLLAELDPGKRPHEIPGLFLVDIQADQVEPIRNWLGSRDGLALTFSPMVKGRYRGANGKAAKEGGAWSREDEDAREMRNREQNLSFRERLSDGEILVAGKWMDPEGDTLEASLEEWFAKRLGVGLGDSLRFDVQGMDMEAKVTSLRRVHWASFQPNFFVLLSPWALRDAPQTWIGSVSGLDNAAREPLQTELTRRFPNVTVIDVGEATQKIIGIMQKIIGAIRGISLFSMLTGLLVLVGVALSTARERRHEAALLRTLGASRRQILSAIAAEFGALGLLSAALGLGLALLFGWLLIEKALEIPFQAPWLLIAAMASIFTALGSAAGVLANIPVLRSKPLSVLREE